MHLPQGSGGHRSVSYLLILILLVGGVLLAFLNGMIATDESRRSLEERARTIAYALDASEIEKLEGTTEDLDSALYRDLKTKLTSLKLVNTDARSLYLAGITSGEPFYFVDSEAPESQYYAPPGENIEYASNAFTGVFSSKQPLVEGPVSDEFGTWITGLAPIVSAETGQVIAIVGINVDAAKYNESIIIASARPLLLALILIVVILIYDHSSRRGQQLLRMRSELVSIASHELRSPITGIRWAAESLLKSTDKKSQPTVKAIYDSVLHLQASIEDILQLTHVTNQQVQKLQLAPTNMTALIQEICDTQRLPADQKQVKLVVDESWPKELIVVCDADKMKRALHNIISNAIKYTKTRTDVVIHYAQKDKQHQIFIIDHGIGIPKAEQGRVFAGFYRASNAKATGIGGTGLGLYLTKTVLEQHGGTVGFSSEEGVGTTFILSLPIKK